MEVRKGQGTNQAPLLFRFSEFELDEAKCELRRQGTRVTLQPKVLALLSYLIRNRERVVSMGELLEVLWPDESVTQYSVTTCLRKARQALHPHGDHLLQTLRRQGIRFVGACDLLDPPTHSGSATEPRTDSGHRAPPGIVGREREVTFLQEALDEALTGHGRTILLAGTQGIGKSTLIRTLSEIAQAAGAVLLVGAGYEGEGAPTFWPWIEVLRAASAAIADVEATTLSRDTGAALATLVPEILPEASPAVIEGDSAQVRFRLYDAISQFLRRAAQRSPLVVVIEDIHWTDAVSVALLRFIAHQVGTCRLLLVATLRDGADTPSEAVQAEIARLSSDVTVRVIRIDGLNSQATTDLVERLVRTPLPAGLSEGIRQASGGVPLFVEQLAAHLCAAAEGSSDPKAALTAALATVPEESADIIARNLAKLSAATRNVLAVAAVIGNDFDLDRLVQLLRLESSVALGAARGAARAAMKEALRANVITADGPQDELYRFAHGLFRNVTYKTIDSERRSRLHWLAGTEGERRMRQGDGESSEVAEHFVRGVEHGSPGKTVEFCLRAAALATQRTDFTRASALLEHADRVARRDERQTTTRRAEILIALVENLAWSGKTNRAREVAGRAIALAHSTHSSKLLARAVLGCGQTLHPHADIDRERIVLLDQALKGLPRTEVSLRVRTLRLLAWEHFYDDDRGAARTRFSQEAVDLARVAGTPHDLLEALEGQVDTLAAPDQFDQHRAATSELVALATRLGNPRDCSHALGHQAFVNLELGRLEEANALEQEANRLGRLAHSPRSLVRAELWQCLISTARGEWATADEHVSKALQLAQFISDELAETIPWNRAHGAFLRGVIPPEAIQSVVDRFPGRPEFSLFLIISLVQAGMWERARATIESRFPTGIDDFPWDRRWLPLAVHFGLACSRMGNREHCAATYEKLLAYDGRHLVLGNRGGASYFGSVGWGLGVLASALSKWAAGEDHLATATSEFRKMTARPFLALALCDHAELLHRQGRARDQARIQRFVDEAGGLAKNLGMEALQRRLDQLSRGDKITPSMLP